MKVVTLKTFMNVNAVVQPGREIEVEAGRGAQLIKLGLARAAEVAPPAQTATPPAGSPSTTEPGNPGGAAALTRPETVNPPPIPHRRGRK
jgi:hypothetical protein